MHGLPSYLIPPLPPYSVLELDQGLRERSERFDREKQMLLDQNKQLKVELDKVMEAPISKLKYAFSSSLIVLQYGVLRLIYFEPNPSIFCKKCEFSDQGALIHSQYLPIVIQTLPHLLN